MYNIKVLLVEDDKKVNLVLSNLLGRFCNELINVYNGQEGLLACEDYSFDLIISDINMPIMDGVEMAKTLRDRKIYTPVVFMTAFNDTHYKNLALSVGAYNYILKPADLSKIKEIFEEINEMKKSNERMLHKDLSSGLSNKDQLTLDLIHSDYTCLYTISIDNFLTYRSTLGSGVAEDIIKKAKKVIKETTKLIETSQLYKIGDDMFGLLTYDETTTDKMNNATLISKNISDLELDYEGTIIDVTCTIGIGDGTNMLGESLYALDKAINNKLYYSIYSLDHSQNEYEISALQLQHRVRKAISDKGIEVHFQPIVDKNKSVDKYEALARLRDNDNNSLIPPYLFLEPIKNSKNYEDFTKEVIKQAVSGARKLKCGVSINISFEDVINSNILDYFVDILDEYYDVELTVELLESESLEDIEKTIEFCTILKSYGVKIAIDDFGSGYSNFNYFFDIPFDILKIDGSLIKKVNTHKGYKLLEFIVNFAKSINVTVIAEFVEDKDTFDKLSGLGIELFQGYYIDKPKPLNELIVNS